MNAAELLMCFGTGYRVTWQTRPSTGTSDLMCWVAALRNDRDEIEVEGDAREFLYEAIESLDAKIRAHGSRP